MLKSEKGVAIGFFLFGAFMYYGSTLIPEAIYSEGAAGTALFPKILAIFIAALSVLMYVESYFREKRNQTPHAQRERSSWSKEKKVFGLLITVLLYIVLIKPIGFVVMTFLFSVATMAFLGGPKLKKKYPVVILVSALTTIITYLLFSRVLNVFLPAGILM